MKNKTSAIKRLKVFTPVEVVTIIAILGVMAAVVVPMINSHLG